MTSRICGTVQIIAQNGVVRPEDKAAGHAMGLCVKAKVDGLQTFVRFKAKKLREKKVGHHSMATKVRA